ncbi:MAG: glycosyltransferase family 4 protein [Gammaproteobacteria bacterium]|nr:glycosyltransferase family 4 protein [Gammaproteobacteria bacterium]
MRILFCNYEYPPLGGGGGVINAMVAEELARDHYVGVVTSQAADLPRYQVLENVHVLRVPVLGRSQQAVASFPSMASFIPQAMRLGLPWARQQHFDILNTHFVLPTGPAGQYLANHLDIPNVLFVHGGDLYDPSKRMSPHRHWILRLVIRHLLGKAAHVIGQSNNTLDNLARFYRDDVATTLIPLAIREPPKAATTRADHDLAAEDFVLITVGRLIPRKAIDQLVGIIASLGDPRIKLLVIGSGPLAEPLSAQAAAAGIADQVRFAGQVGEEEKFDLLALADAYVSTSQHEGFGIVFLEAMASGLPVICYGHGGQTDFLVDGRTGFLPSLNEQDAFAARVRELASDPKLVQGMADFNRKLARDFYIDRCAARHLAVFEKVLAERRQA